MCVRYGVLYQLWASKAGSILHLGRFSVEATSAETGSRNEAGH